MHESHSHDDADNAVSARDSDIVARDTSGRGAVRARFERILRAAAIWTSASVALSVAATGAVFELGCNSAGDASADASVEDADAELFDLCDAFTEVGSACPTASPVRCFPLCEAGGCYCSETAQGPRWKCVLDLSCQPACAPIDDACAPDSD
jgi:hypothetical protein